MHSPELFLKESYRDSFTEDGRTGCKVNVEFITDKVGGNFMLVVNPLPGEDNGPIGTFNSRPLMFNMPIKKAPNLK